MKIRNRVKELRMVPAKDLLANPKNWREHPKEQADAMREVLESVGFAGAVLARETPEGLMLIDGHLRKETAPDATVPVLVLDVTEKEADTILATFDPISAMATANGAGLRALVESLDLNTGALSAMLDETIAEAAKGLAGPVTEDEAPAPLPDPVSKTGDLWLLGEHRVLCGDSTKGEDVSACLAGAVPFIMVTDPPYGVDYEGGASNKVKREKLAGDADADLYDAAFGLCPCPIAYTWFAGSRAGDVYRAAMKHGFKPRAMIVWNKLKPHYGAASADYKQRHEPCLYSVRKPPSKFIGDMSEPTVWDIEQPRVNEHHPTQKPVECMSRPIRNHDAPEVYEPFSGSGTTIIAAEQLARKCYAIEIEPRYVDVAIRRWSKLTGREATHAETGKTWTEMATERGIDITE